jgi:hypothetical protein
MLNFESVGSPIAEIKPNEGSRSKRGPIISLASPEQVDEVHHGFPEYSLNNARGRDYHFEVSVNTDTERQIIYVSGSSGSGKSYWCRRYVESYQKAYPKREVYLLSAISEDSSIDKIKGLNRIKLTPSFIEDQLTAEDFKDSCCIFDDCDTISDSKLRKAVMKLQDDILQTGRHFNVTALITSHVATNGKDTRLILAEAHIITFFPQMMPQRSLKYLLESYMGLSKEDISKVKKLSGRSVSYIKGFPRCLVSDKEIFILRLK